MSRRIRPVPVATLLVASLPGLFSLASGDDDLPPRKLAMTPAVVCAKVNGYGDYVPMDRPALSRDEKMLVYYETSGHAYEAVGKEYRVHLVQDGRIRRKGEKRVLLAKDKLVVYKGKSKQPPLNLFLSNSITLKSLAPGEYEMEIILHDELGKGATASQILDFRVKAEDGPEGRETTAETKGGGGD